MLIFLDDLYPRPIGRGFTAILLNPNHRQSMKSGKNSQSLRHNVANPNHPVVQPGTVSVPKPLLKATTRVPVAPSQDETDCFIKGYN